ncbi:MAG: hypothetical protein ACREHG_06820, partial [Candidatus Saccharimonadales bacterium]
MSLFSTDSIARYALQGEQQLSRDRPFLVDRYSPAIVDGTSTYSVPDSLLSIRRITWKGFKLDPMPYRLMRESFQSATQQGRPYWYIFDNIGQSKVRLFPTPMENLSAGTDLFSPASVADYCIIEFNRVADAVNWVIPAWKERQLIKQYTNMRCYEMEGAGQNLKLYKYFKVKWELWSGQWFKLLDDLQTKARKLIIDEIHTNQNFPGKPILPID